MLISDKHMKVKYYGKANNTSLAPYKATWPIIILKTFFFLYNIYKIGHVNCIPIFY
jgi:hypothetical protein